MCACARSTWVRATRTWSSSAQRHCSSTVARTPRVSWRSSPRDCRPGAAAPNAVTLVDAVRPEVALISVGAGSRYGHPTPETLAGLGGITTFRTDRDGTVEVSLDGPGLVVRAHANGLPPPRRGSVPYAPARR